MARSVVVAVVMTMSAVVWPAPSASAGTALPALSFTELRPPPAPHPGPRTGGHGTRTAVGVDPGLGLAWEPVMLTATISPVTATGSVAFRDGDHLLGSAPVVDGVAALTTSELGAGAHTIRAVFTPSHPHASCGGSSDTSLPFVLSLPDEGPEGDAQSIVATIVPGALVVSTPYGPGNPLDVGTLLLNAAATQYTGAARFEDIAVTDTRAGDLPWTLTALAGDLVDGTTDSIDGQNVGLTAMTEINGPRPLGVALTDNPAADPAVGPGGPGVLGLGGATKTVAHADLGLGAWVLAGVLSVNAPAATPAGRYAGTVTFTVS